MKYRYRQENTRGAEKEFSHEMRLGKNSHRGGLGNNEHMEIEALLNSCHCKSHSTAGQLKRQAEEIEGEVGTDILDLFLDLNTRKYQRKAEL